MRRRSVSILVIIGGVIISASLVGRVFSYDTNIAHPALTDLASELYNSQAVGDKLSPEEIGWLKLGAIDEDYPFRWMNHFYDPVHNVGFKDSYDTAKIWAQNPHNQTSFSLGDQSWQRAVYNFQQGNKKQAFIALGHIIHLLEDMTVPAHTRDDAHPEGDPYEQWAKKNFKSVTGQLIYFDSINQYFDYLAGYSNGNFFSKDTIQISKFSSPQIENTDEGDSFLYSSDNGTKYKIVAYIKNSITNKKEYFINPEVSTDYFSILAPKAVGAGAGVVKLFFEEASKGQVKEPTFFQTNLLGVLQKPVGRLVQLAEGVLAGAEQIYDSLKTKTAPTTLAQSGGEIMGKNDQFLISNVKSNPNVQIPTPNNQPPTEQIKKAESQPIIASVIPALPLPTQNLPTTPSVSYKPQVTAPLLYGGGGSGGSPSPQATLTPPTTSTSTPDPTPQLDTTPPPAPILDNLFAEIIYTTSSGANIFGAVSTDTIKVLSYFSTTTLTTVPNSDQEGTAPSSTRFDFSAVFNSGHNYFYFSAKDEANNTSTLSLPAHFVFDVESPTVPTVIVDNQTSADSANLHLTINSSDILSPTIFYDVAYRQSTTNTWQDLATNTTTNQFDFSGSRGGSYFFRARAFDGLGNTSIWSDENTSSTPTFVDWSKEVAINEVAWAGNSAQYSNDEWLELYNNTEQEIDLRWWKIFVSGRQISWSTSTVKNPVIPAHGYYLLERTYDNNIKDVAADIIYTLQYGFKNIGEKIELFKPDGIKVDEVDCSTGWFAGDNIKYRTMERISSTKPGNDPKNWQSNQGPRVTPRSYNGGYIYGSPKASNFGFIMLGGSQEDSVATFTAGNSPYVLIDYSVPAGKTLKIEPGVVIKAYRGSKIDIYGSLEAKGATDKPIIFTSGKDQSFANSSFNTIVGAWSTTTPMAKDWQGLWFRAGATGTLDHMEMRYAGYDFRPTISNLLSSQAVRADSATVNISNSIFNNTGDTIVYLSSSTSTISGSNFQNGVLAVDAQQSDLTLSGSNFVNFSNSRGPVNIKGKWPSLDQLTFSGNASDMVYLESVALEKNTSYPRELNYLVIGGELLVSSSTTFTLEPGATMNLAKYGVITVQGTLSAPGTSEAPVTIQPAPSSTYWGHIKFDGSTSNLSYVNFNRGGLLASMPANLDGALLINNSTVILDNINVANSRSPGNSIQTGSSTVTIRNSQITKTQKYAGQDTGIKVNSGQLNLDNVLFNNFYIGLLGINNGALPGLQMSNMSSSSFLNVDFLIQPTNWLAVTPT